MPRKKKTAVLASKPPSKPRRSRKRPVLVHTPPVVMAMPWLTRGEVTVSYVCPMCRTRREVAPGEATRLTGLRHVPLEELACGEACRAQWWLALMVAIQATGQQYVLSDSEWVWELEQGVVAERLAEVLQAAAPPTPPGRQTWLARN